MSSWRIIPLLLLTACKPFASDKAASVAAKPATLSQSADTTRAEAFEFLETEPQENDDTVLIISPLNDTQYYSPRALDIITQQFPMLNQDIPDAPEIAYARSGYFKSFTGTDGKPTRISFSSELGHDEFCLLYAHFLRLRYSDKAFPQARQKLTRIFLTLNTLFSTLSYGGTYYGHQSSRLAAEAEYGSYLLNKYPKDMLPTWNFTRQKTLYLELLRQQIADELAQDKETTAAHDRKGREQTLNGYVNTLDKLITDGFLLKEVQRFQYAFY